MQLRILRTWQWVANRDMSIPIGRKVPLHLVAKDELQFRDHHGDWLPLPIVETEKPDHPDVVEDKRRNEEMQAVDRLVADGKIKFPNAELTGAKRPG